MGRPGKALTPYASVRDVVGWLVRQTRERHQLDPKELGRATGYAENTVTAFERAERRPSPAFLAGCDQIFGTDGLFAALGPLMDLDVPSGRGEQVPGPSGGPHGVGGFPRRHEVSHGGTAPVRVERVTLDPLEDTIVLWIDREGGTVPVRLNRRELMTFGVDVGVAAVLATKGRAGATRQLVDPGIAARYRSARQTLVATDNLLGPGPVIPVVTDQLGRLAEYRTAARGGLRTQLLVVEALWTEFYGWLADDIGRPDLADRHTGAALTMAIEAGDDTLESYILMRQAQRAAAGGDPRTTIGLAAAAQRHRQIPVRVRAAAVQQEACGHALDGSERHAIAKINEAHSLVAANPPPDEHHPDLAAHCTPAYVLAHEARCWLLLDKPGKAVASFTMAIHQLGDAYHRDAGLYTALLARAHAASGDLQQAARAGLDALTIGAGTQSARTLTELGVLHRRLEVDVPRAGAIPDFRAAYAEVTRPAARGAGGTTG